MIPHETPEKLAIRLSHILKQYHENEGTSAFPRDTASLAEKISQQFFPDTPITLIKGESFSQHLDGMLVPHHEGNAWCIIYNTSMLECRKNFTIAHELGHYLLHRSQCIERKCSNADLTDWYSRDNRYETEANCFAAYFLMPLDDVREQIHNKKISKSLIQSLSSRYGVSKCVSALRWMKVSGKRAMLVAGNDGFIDWASSSEKLFKSGIFYKKAEIVELPSESLAMTKTSTDFEKTHAPHIWKGDESVREILLSQYNEFSLSLLIYPDVLNYEDIDDTTD